MKRMLLITDKNLMSGMFELAKDLEGDIYCLKYTSPLYRLCPFLDKFNFKGYEEVVTFLYPLHIFGKKAKKQGIRWICYDNETPPATKQYFPNFLRRQYMKLFNKLNKWSMQGADEYWDIKTTWQKPRFSGKKELTDEFRQFIIDQKRLQNINDGNFDYSIYLGRTTDYKNYEWLKQTMKEMGIFLIHPENVSDDVVHALLSNAKLLVTASIWEGYGRSVPEAENLGIAAVSFDTGAHKRNTNLGMCVENYDFEALKEAIKSVWERETTK